MKAKHLKILMLILLAGLFFAPPCLAKSKGYFYVVAYSYRHKKAFCSSIFVQTVKDTSYSDEEFVTDVGLVQEIEAAFEKYLAEIVGVNLRRYTMSSRGAYKSYAIAKRWREEELTDYEIKGMTVQNVPKFKFKSK